MGGLSRPVPGGRRVVFRVVLITGILTLVMPVLSCLMGLPGVVGGALGAWYALRSGADHRELRAAWYGFFGAAVSTMVALSVHLLLGTFDPPNVAPYLDSYFEGLVSSGDMTAEEAGDLRQELWVQMVEALPLMPFYCLIFNAVGGAFGGRLVVGLWRRRLSIRKP